MILPRRKYRQKIITTRLELTLFKGQGEKEPAKKHAVGRRERSKAKGVRFQRGSDQW